MTARFVVISLAIGALALAASSAYAASTRAEYVAQVEPICQTERSQEKAAFRSFKKRIGPITKREGGFDSEKPPKVVIRIAKRYYDQLVAIQRATNTQISSVPPPPGDEMAISQWLQLRGRSTDLLERATRAAVHGKTPRALKLFARSFNSEADAELTVRDFGFKACTPYLAVD